MDKTLERQFQESYLDRSKNYLRKTILVTGIFFFLFFINDLMVNGLAPLTAYVILCRLTLLTLSLLFYFNPNVFLRSPAFLKITMYEFAAVIIFFIIILNYKHSHFLTQAFAVNVIVLAIFFLLPNLLHNKLILSTFTSISYLIISILSYHPSNQDVVSVIVYFSLTIFFSSISTYSLGKYQRLDFVNKQYFAELSTKDPLTNIYNRQKFNEALISEITLAKRYESTFSLIMFDIDHFKQFNDSNGHIFGDKVLIHAANLVRGSIREVDVFARWGGEEFVILLPQTDCDEASSLAERLRKLIYKESMKHNISLTCSFGVTSFFSEDNEDSIMNRVDMALYRAKENGRNRVVTEHIPQTHSA